MSRPFMPVYFQNDEDIGSKIRSSKNPFVEGLKESSRRIIKSQGFSLFKNIILLILLIFIFAICIINLINYIRVNEDYSDNQDNYLYNTAVYAPYTANASVIVAPPASGNIIWNNAKQKDATTIFVSVINSLGTNIQSTLSSLLIKGNNFIIKSSTESSDYQIWNITGEISTVTGNYVSIPVKLEESSGAGTNGFVNAANLTLLLANTNLKGTSRRVSESMLILGIVANSIIAFLSFIYIIIII